MKTRSKVLIVLVGMACLLALGATYAWAQTTGGVINACKLKDNTIYILTSGSCRKSETQLTWNVMGPPGLACWDLNGNGNKDASEDINQDGDWNAKDCTGPQGIQGEVGPKGDTDAQGRDDERGGGGRTQTHQHHRLAAKPVRQPAQPRR